MDDLLQEFIAQTAERMAALDNDLLALEKRPDDAALLQRIFRAVHMVKGSCGFLGLPRLETVAHHAENVLGRYRSGALEVTPDSVSLILQSIDRIKDIVAAVAATGREPQGDDAALVALLDMAAGKTSAQPSRQARAQQDETTPKSMRVSVETLENIMATVGEVVLARN